jgi:uncharacterized protein YukE
MADLRIRPDELQAGATELAGHADTLGTHLNTITGAASELPAAFAGFGAVLAPILARFGELHDGVGQVAEQARSLSSSVGATGGQATELDQRSGTAIRT